MADFFFFWIFDYCADSFEDGREKVSCGLNRGTAVQGGAKSTAALCLSGLPRSRGVRSGWGSLGGPTDGRGVSRSSCCYTLYLY